MEKRLRLAMLRADLRLRPAEWAALCIAAPLAAGTLGLAATHQALAGLVLGSARAGRPARSSFSRGRHRACAASTPSFPTP